MKFHSRKVEVVASW